MRELREDQSYALQNTSGSTVSVGRTAKKRSLPVRPSRTIR